MKDIENTNLFDEFPPISTNQWEQIIIKDLKGADYQKKLVWKSPEGFHVKPYYRKEDLAKNQIPSGIPGQFPFVRGNEEMQNNWLIRNDIEVCDAKSANAKAMNAIKSGVNSIAFYFDESLQINDSFLDDLLKEIPIEEIEINFVSQSHVASIIEYLIECNKSFKEASVHYSVLGHLSSHGDFIHSEEKDFELAYELCVAARKLNNFKIISIDGDLFHNSGALLVQELGFSLAQAADYLVKLQHKGLDAKEIASRMKFHFASGSNYFFEIAKLRAARYLWTKLLESFNVNSHDFPKMSIHSSTSRWNKSQYDPYVNLLRTTTESMAAILGGCNSLSTEPFNIVFEESTPFSERIAKNQQIILREESYFDKVVDPSAGSYYIETLTHEIAQKAWNIFLATEEIGGYTEAFKKGWIQKEIAQVAHERNIQIAQRREIILGVNQYPNFSEVAENIDPGKFKENEQKGTFEALKPYRGAEAFEMLRFKTDLFAKKNFRPKVFMLTMGNLAMRRARAQFAANFFACAGFQISDNNGFSTVEEAVDAFRKSKAQIAVLCSSDEEYADLAPELIKRLNTNDLLIVAGLPSCKENLEQNGIKHFIHARMNILKELIKYQQLLGIE